jgi:hypothetical protein
VTHFPRVLYLDLKDWIDLSRGRLRRPGHEAQEGLYEALRAAVAAGDVLAPLSTAHYIEMFNIKDPQQRAEVALTMGRVSRHVTLTSRETMIAHELRVALARNLKGTYDRPAPDPVGYGFAHAFGRSGTVRIGGPPETLEPWAAQSGDAVIDRIEEHAGFGWQYEQRSGARRPLERIQDALDAATQFMMLRGPADGDIDQLTQNGYNPSAALSITEAIRKREVELAAILAAEPVPAARLTEYIAARAWVWDLLEHWDAALVDVGLSGLTWEQIGKERIHQIVADIPIIAVESAVRQRRFANGSYRWRRNDIYDLSFIGQAVVYCDALLTDKDMRMHLVLQGTDRKHKVEALRDRSALVEWLRTMRD